MSSREKQIYETRAEKEITIKGMVKPIGTKLIRGAECPRCKKHYPCSMRVVYCNNCGYRSAGLKPHEEKKKQKEFRRMEYEKAKNKKITGE